MRFGNSFLVGRLGFIVSVIGALLCVLVMVYCGYQVWKNIKTDIGSAQNIRELQLLLPSVPPLSNKLVTGDASVAATFAEVIENIDQRVIALSQGNQVSKQPLPKEYTELDNLWRSIRDKASMIENSVASVKVINREVLRLEENVGQAQDIIVNLIGRAGLSGATEAQIDILKQQSLILRRMLESMQIFSAEATATIEPFDIYRAAFAEFLVNHQVLLNGDSTGAIRSFRSQDLRDDLVQAYSLVDDVTPRATVISTAETLLLARDAHATIVASFERLKYTLADILSGVIKFEKSRSYQSIYAIVMIAAAVVFILCLAGIAVSYRNFVRESVTKEQSEDEDVQGAILRLLDELADLADGDLTVTTTVSEDFTGAIADSVNYTIDQLRQLVSRINTTAVQVSGAAQESRQTALHLAEASDHQAQEIAGVSSAINEMAVTIDQVSANAAESALVAGKSVSIANNGAKLVQNTIHGMDTIREQIQDTSKRIKRLGESSQEIGDIVSLINDIADQTNILALNAAIQASMAGDAGRGFAVVADEVQRLAERSAAATKQIESLVKTIQADTNEAVISMEQTTTEVVGGARLAQDAGVALEEIEGVSANIAELVQNISNAARQQASSAGHISDTMNVIQEITLQTSAGTGATAQAIGDLAGMALELRESVAGFKLPENADAESGLDAENNEDWLSEADTDFMLTDSDDILADTEGASAEFDLPNDASKYDNYDLTKLFENEDFDLENHEEFELSDDEDLDLSHGDDAGLDLSHGDDAGLDLPHEDDEDLDLSHGDDEGLELADAEDEDLELSDEEVDLTAFDFADDKENSPMR